MEDALELAIKAAGGLTRLAERIRVTPQVIVNWRHRGIPAVRVLDIEKATANADDSPIVTRHQLRPDLYPPQRRAA